MATASISGIDKPVSVVQLIGGSGAAVAGLTNPVATAYPSFSASAVFTPANTSHTAGDVVGGAKEFALGAPTGALLRIVNASMLVAGGTNETSTWRLYMFSVTPPSALADDAAFLLPSGDRASFLGYFDFAQLVDVGDTLFIEATPNKVIRLTGTSVFAYLVNLTTVTTAAVARTVTLHTSLAPS
jgi:hypothetical protein